MIFNLIFHLFKYHLQIPNRKFVKNYENIHRKNVVVNIIKSWSQINCLQRLLWSSDDLFIHLPCGLNDSNLRAGRTTTDIQHGVSACFIVSFTKLIETTLKRSNLLWSMKSFPLALSLANWALNSTLSKTCDMKNEKRLILMNLAHVSRVYQVGIQGMDKVRAFPKREEFQIELQNY